MAEKTSQTLANHVRLDPLFHLFLGPVSMITFIWMIVKLVRYPDLDHAALVVLALAGVVAVFKIRLYALKVQDRVIRLEERLRMTALLPEALHNRVSELTESQIVALRFASDTELSGLVESTLANNWKSGDIKKAIQVWRPDYFRV